MSLKDTFCSSPWMHAKITHDGQFHACRWQKDTYTEYNESESIHSISPITFFKDSMSEIRKNLLDGKNLDMCNDCYEMDKHNKVSGRQKQLLKSGILTDQFEKTTLSSPMLEYFKQSMANGETDLLPIDWQVDLGNYCNSNCVFCHPMFSSSLATEYKKLGIITEMPKKSWTEYPELVDDFVNTLAKTDQLAYIHFLGGETLITPAFKKMLTALVDKGISHKVSIGFTTNLTVWRDDLVDLLSKFKMVNLGMSVECLNKINDYVRYPSDITQVRSILDKWIAVAHENDWLLQFRITPTLFTVNELVSIYEFAYQKDIAVESCNFLTEPEILRPGVLPREHIDEAVAKLKNWVADKDREVSTVVNTRNPTYAKDQIVQDAKSYIKWLEEAPDETDKQADLVTFLKKIESNRNNSILDYLPKYEQFLRTAGY